MQKNSSSLYRTNLWTVDKLNNWPHNPTNNFPLNNCLFAMVKLVRNNQGEFTYNGRGIAFNGEGL